MPTIPHSEGCCTVIVTVDAGVEIMPELEAHARDGIERFARFDGFIAGALHKSEDGTRLVQYLQWRSEADHLACMNDPLWNDVPSTQRFMQRVDAGEAQIDVRTYRVIAARDATGD